MADTSPGEVAAAIDPVCFESNNPLVHQLLVDIAAKLPSELARDLTVHETAWVLKQESLIYALSREGCCSC